MNMPYLFLIIILLITYMVSTFPVEVYNVSISGLISPGYDELEAYCKHKDIPLYAIGSYSENSDDVVFIGTYTDKFQGSITCKFYNRLITNQEVRCLLFCRSN